MTGRWEFWIDRGGTFTDVVARRPDGTPGRPQAALGQSRPVPGRGAGRHPRAARRAGRAAHPGRRRSGRSGWAPPSPPTRCWSAGVSPPSWSSPAASRDALRIGYQNRPRIFDRQIVLPELLYAPGDRGDRAGQRARRGDRAARRGRRPPGTCGPPTPTGFRAVAVVCLHGYRYPAHEARIGEIARDIGFTQVSESHATSPLMKLVSRGDTTVVDAYLSPDPGPLRRPGDRRAARDAGAVHAVQRRAGRRAPVPRQGLDPVRAGRRHRRHGPRPRRGRLRPGHRLRHGRHLHRRVALRRRVRAAVRDRGGRGPDAGADAEHPHRRGRRRLDPALRRQPVPGRPGLGGRETRDPPATGAAARSP